MFGRVRRLMAKAERELQPQQPLAMLRYAKSEIERLRSELETERAHRLSDNKESRAQIERLQRERDEIRTVIDDYLRGHKTWQANDATVKE